MFNSKKQYIKTLFKISAIKFGVKNYKHNQYFLAVWGTSRLVFNRNLPRQRKLFRYYQILKNL